jgi:hypothetical protein
MPCTDAKPDREAPNGGYRSAGRAGTGKNTKLAILVARP